MKKTIILIAIFIALTTLLTGQNTTELLVGDPASTLSHASRVLNFNQRFSVSQTIYFEEEMVIDDEPITGVITQIKYFYNKTGTVDYSDLALQFYYAPTTLQNFANTTAWLPFSDFELIYDGPLELPTAPTGTVGETTIVLNKPIVYEGGNFIILAIKEPPEGTPNSLVSWRVSRTIARSRNLLYTTNTPWPDFPNVFPTSQAITPAGDFPTTGLTFYNDPLGHLIGTVTVGGEPLDNVRVSIDDSKRFTFSNASGNYTIPHIPVGSLNLTAAKYLYHTVNIEGVNITANQNTTQNITMVGVDCDLNAISITGTSFPVAEASTTHTIRVRNDAFQTQSAGYTVQLRQVGVETPLATAAGVSIEPQEFFDFEIDWTPIADGDIEIYGYIILEADENQENNTTDLLALEIQPAGTNIAYIGDFNSTVFARENPMDHFNRSSLSQTIYLADEFEVFGAISQILYRFRGYGDIASGSPIRVYLAHTDLDNFGTTISWVPYSEFTLVFNGVVPTNRMGDYDLPIKFDTPYPYRGGNLVVMIHKSEDATYNLGNTYHQTNTTGINRTLSASGAGVYNPSVTYPSPTRRARYANATFFTLTQGTGTLSGNVTLGGAPIDEVKIVINDYNVTTYTNAEGFYSFPYLMPDTYSITASKHAHQTQTIADIVIVANETTTQNISMISIPFDLAGISITGPTTPIAQATATFNVRIRNEGYDTVTPSQYSVALKQVGVDTPLGSVPGVEIEPAEELAFQIDWIPTTLGSIQVYGEAIFAADLDLSNNKTAEFATHIQAVGTNVVYIGTSTSTAVSSMAPINYLWRNSLSQTIYLNSELTSTGAITGMVFRQVGTGAIPADHPVSIWMAPTDRALFAAQDSWIPFEEFDLVYHGTPTSPVGPVDFYLPFDTDFIHAGGNLAVMIYKHHTPAYVSSIQWQITNTSAATGGQRTLYAYNDTVILDPFNPVGEWPTAYNAYIYGNTSLMVTEEGYGHISGIVLNAGEPVEGIEISLNGTSRKVFTNELGEYTIPYVYQGTASITARKHGYYDHSVNNINITAGVTTPVDFNMPPIPTYIVSGTLISSNTGAGVADADLWLTGYENYHVTTNASGSFNFPAVYELKTYTLEIHKSGYVRYIDELIEVGSSNLTIPPITLLERAYPVNNLQAVSNPSTVQLTWEAPTGGLDTWMYYTHQNTSAGGWQSMVTPYNVSTAIRFTGEQLDELGVAGAELTKVSYFLHTLATPGIHTIRLYSGGFVDGTGSGAAIDEGNLIYEQLVDTTNIVAGQWNDVELDYIIDIPIGEEFWIAVNVTHSSGFVLGRDALQTVAPGYSDIIDYGEGWRLFGWALTTGGNNMIRGLASNAHGPITIGFVDTPTFMGTKTTPPTFMGGGWGGESNRSDTYTPNSLSITRSLTGYRIWRANIDTLNDENTWDLLGTFTGLSHTDNEWGVTPDGAYRYVVKSIYTQENISRPVFSNMVHRGMEGTFDVILTSSDAVPIQNATVRLINNSGNPIHVYEQSSTTNIIHFPVVWRGTYTMLVTAPGYRTHYDNNVQIAPNAPALNITMIRPLVPQFVVAEETAEGAVISWVAPDPGIDVWFSHTNATGPIENGIGTDGGGTFIIAHRYAPAQLQSFGVIGATLTAIAYAPWTLATSHEIRIYTGGSAAPYSPGSLVHSQAIDNSTLVATEFNEILLNTPVFIQPNLELWIAIHTVTPTLSRPLGVDNGPAVNGYGNIMHDGSVWTTLIALNQNLNYNWAIRGMAEGGSGAIVFGSDIDIPYPHVDEREVKMSAGEYVPNLSGNIFLSDVTTAPIRKLRESPHIYGGGRGGNNFTRVEMRAFTRSTNSQFSPYIQPITRSASGYSIFRANLEVIDNENLWESIHGNHPETTYTDSTWFEAFPGEYKYIIKALHPNEVVSGPAFSNIILKFPEEFIPPKNFKGEQDPPNTHNVKLTWEAPDGAYPRGYKITREGQPQSELITETTYTESDVPEGLHTYTLVAVYYGGESEPVTTDVDVTVPDGDIVTIEETILKGNYPNPFNPSTIISFDIKEAGPVRIDIFNIRGQRVTTLVDEHKETGAYKAEWNGTDENGRNVASGIYFYRMTALEYSAINRMVLLK